MTRATALAAAVVHFAGALKSTPLLAGLPFDLTLVAALGLVGPLVLVVAGRRWMVGPGLAVPLAACGGLWLWMVLAGVWSPSSVVLGAKLPEAVLLGPAMLAAGMVVGGDAEGLRRFAWACLALGVFVAASVVWGVATDAVVFGGLLQGNPDQVRVQYQIAGLAMASAGGLAAVRAVESRGALAALGWLIVVGALGAAALVPGGRLALLAFGMTVAAAPMVVLWRQQAVLAFFWPLLALAAGGAALAALLADPSGAEGLRTIERFTEGGVGEQSGRLPLWRAALGWAGAAAPLGLGSGGFTIAAGFGERRGMYPHNHALEALAELGLPGFALWLLAFGGGAVAALRLGARVAPWRAARVAALVLPMALSVMVSTDLGNRMAWFALGLALSLGLEARAVRHV